MPATSAAVKEQSIREHAYHLWEQDGRPEGRRRPEQKAWRGQRGGEAQVCGDHGRVRWGRLARGRLARHRVTLPTSSPGRVGVRAGSPTGVGRGRKDRKK